ncbi:group II intron reverse transcriptase/maturase [Pseudomonas marginalis]|uniref:Group II intron reverse transcriptase/maturase n=1 Tax=Pseudomonas marginalis TaxID=298 RepID=A0A9X9BJZ3_PSEMA|nr:group II intron reverse transcriptase/maturase [Pseudomonas marginalis]TWR48082.1 group II intron reverse transcriptase/maturase [Pseudomonas marginalis]SEB32933.1 RNA-directed DNA polymerase [Pseudomonas marginalis]
MTTQEISCAGAPSHESVNWHSIDWARCHREVRRLQARIVKATREGKHGKVKALQWILTHSFSGKALAVRRVTENQGKKTPDVDGITWSTPEAKSQAMLSIKRRGYRPQPLKRVYIPKANGKMRPLGIPTMKDRAMQALYLLALEPVAETTADGRSFGFRPERSTADAIEQCFTALSKKVAPRWVLEGDIKGCFDNISHDWLMGHVPTDREILKKWLKAGYMEDRQLFPTEAGTPPGGIISPTLANLVLDGLEAKLDAAFGRKRYANGVQTRLMVNYVRYADDFIVTGRSKELLEQEVMPIIEDFMQERGLTLSPEKTKITHIDEGFDFLGQNVRKYNGKLLIKPSKANVATFLDKVRSAVKGNKALDQPRLIRMLNPMIQGWANYHQHVVSKETFARVDHEIWRVLWQWAVRRHPQKSSVWVKQRYFHSVGSRNWVFAAETGERFPDGSPILSSLRKATDTPIRRHRPIKLEANPFDPMWETYFEERVSLKMQNSLRGRKKLTDLWLEQDRRCPICQQLITQETGWHVHHITRRVDGGKDGSTNLVMVHPNCHNQIHVKGLKVVKPVRASGL